MSPEEKEMLKKLARENGIFPELYGQPDELAAALNSALPKVRLPTDDRQLGHFAGEVGEIMCARDFFRRDLTTMTVNADKQRLDPVTPEAMRTWVEYHLVCFKEKSITAGGQSKVIQVVKTMNVDTAKGTLASRQFWSQLKEIDRLNQTRLPVMRKDGRIELMPPGYFAERKIYTLEDGITYDEEMTVEEAKQIIDDLLSEFPFKDDRSRAVQVAAMLTMFGAGLIPQRAQRPGFVITANAQGAGKTFAAKMAIAPVTGAVAPQPFPRKEEAGKILNVLAMEGKNYVLFDNVRGTIGGEEIEAFLSATEWEGRILGESRKFRVEQVCTCFFTGNDSRTTQDMQERCLFVELFVQEADSRDRKIKRMMDDSYLADSATRSKVLSALWALTRGWDAAGRPEPKIRMNRCYAWSKVIPGIVAWAGYGECCEKPDIGSARGDLDEMRRLVIALAPDQAGTEEWNFAMIMEEIQTKEFFAETELPGKKGDASPLFDQDGVATPAGRSFFGRFFGRFDQRLFAGENPGEKLRFVIEGKGNSRKYLVTKECAPGAPAQTVAARETPSAEDDYDAWERERQPDHRADE